MTIWWKPSLPSSMFLELLRSNCQSWWLQLNPSERAHAFHSFHSSSGRDTNPFQIHHVMHGIGGHIQSCKTIAPTQILAIPITAFITAFYGQRLTSSKIYHHLNGHNIPLMSKEFTNHEYLYDSAIGSCEVIRSVCPICIAIHIFVID